MTSKDSVRYFGKGQVVVNLYIYPHQIKQDTFTKPSSVIG